ncbi:MAG: L-lactate permease [Thermoplasmata archaeon]|nr:L-lactate permease [Thermoplasmata archaeon]
MLWLLAILPMIVVLVGIIQFKKSGSTMAIVGWLITLVLAVLVFRTDLSIALGATVYGLLKSFGITVAVVGTMLMIFLMKEIGALDTISEAIKRVASTLEQQAIFIGIGFGSFVTSLGIVTPSLFPPLLMAMGFSPFAAVSVSVLGYNATTSFALLAIPITLPADIFGLDVNELTYKICLFLPVVSVLISFAMLWVLGGKESIKTGFMDALIAGLVIGSSCLAFVLIGVPVMIIGVLAGLLTMIVLYIYSRFTGKLPTFEDKLDRKKLITAMSPWIILIALALVVSIPALTGALKDVDGAALTIYGRDIDFDIMAQTYTLIFISFFASLYFLKPSKEQITTVFNVWIKRIWGPVIAYSLFFSIAYIMAWSAMVYVGGSLVEGAGYADYNMNNAIGSVLANTFGTNFAYVAACLGLFGAMVGGSETGSNVLFYKIQRQVADNIGATDNQFMTMYGAHANAGGVASAITPSKINNAVATIKGNSRLESAVMQKHLGVVILITIVISFMTAAFVAWNL